MSDPIIAVQRDTKGYGFDYTVHFALVYGLSPRDLEELLSTIDAAREEVARLQSPPAGAN